MSEYPGGARAKITELEAKIRELEELAFYDANLIDLLKTNREKEELESLHSGTARPYTQEYAFHEIKRLRRSLDNIKIRAYELGCKELHDRALEALK